MRSSKVLPWDVITTINKLIVVVLEGESVRINLQIPSWKMSIRTFLLMGMDVAFYIDVNDIDS